MKAPLLEGYGQEDAVHAQKLAELKARIQKLAGNNLHTYTVSWDSGKGVLKGMEKFAAQVTEDLKKLMETDWKAYADLSPYEKDRRFQWDYARQKGEQFRAGEPDRGIYGKTESRTEPSGPNMGLPEAERVRLWQSWHCSFGRQEKKSCRCSAGAQCSAGTRWM